MSCCTINSGKMSLDEMLEQTSHDLFLIHRKLLHLKSVGHTTKSSDFRFFLRRRAVIEAQMLSITQALELLNSKPESATQ